MTDFIARFARLLAALLPAGGKHRSTVTPEPEPLSSPRRPLPEHKSPYARDAAQRQAFVDTINPVRPYVTASPRRRTDEPKLRAQAERRWALEMALRGIDVGPTVIHGRQVRPDGQTIRVAVGA
ncbi:hypothetical protein [Streptomyces sp. NPDC089795]|uniref:hypothetical protein n=1 Tax=Streptomyces sp. NPDC089795 TaxID=3155297 RepID=UPI003422F67C